MIAEQMIPDKATNEKLFAAMVALLSLRFTVIAALFLAALALILFVLSLLVTAIYECCVQISVVWTSSNALEKILFLVLTWAFLAWVARIVRSFYHAA